MKIGSFGGLNMAAKTVPSTYGQMTAGQGTYSEKENFAFISLNRDQMAKPNYSRPILSGSHLGWLVCSTSTHFLPYLVCSDCQKEINQDYTSNGACKYNARFEVW
jgi:hypothetical protein